MQQIFHQDTVMDTVSAHIWVNSLDGERYRISLRYSLMMDVVCQKKIKYV